ncbi:uncharacterized protein LOC101461675 [Ceratitis capitata]|uniref:(Mediterranean fruit fly) hypothetical protein n=1 Tax=Ceratitis capitata TaxID=7213 RepID=A0A811V9A8_CERCA|nr:uncharacterized protein LOC101461675 [Ceratitis capitata]CAD7011920.1 unnamed protein product [Ceratitis capitata]
MNLLLQRSTRSLFCAFSRQNVQISACVRTKRSDASDNTNTSTSGTGARQQQNNTPLSKITLVHPNQNIVVITFKEAQKLAKRRELHLVKQQDYDTKTQRPVYKLVTAGEMLSEDVDESVVDKKSSSEKKSEKTLTIGSRITDHDLSSRLKHISKWLAKNHEVCVFIQGAPNEIAKCEGILKTIEQSVKEPEVIGRIVQKRIKGSNIKFNILPIQKTTSDTVTQA